MEEKKHINHNHDEIRQDCDCDYSFCIDGECFTLNKEDRTEESKIFCFLVREEIWKKEFERLKKEGKGAEAIALWNFLKEKSRKIYQKMLQSDKEEDNYKGFSWKRFNKKH